MKVNVDLRYNRTMKTATIVASMFLGLLLGTTVAVASASVPTAAHLASVTREGVAPPPVEVEASSEAPVVTIPEVVVHGRRPKPARKAKVWTCGDWQESQVGGKYKACEWK